MSSGHVKMADTVSLFGGRVPAHVELLYKHLKDLDRSTFQQILAGKNMYDCMLCFFMCLVWRF